MAVLVEGVSVLVRREAIERDVPGGWDQFVDAVPNAMFCYDGELARVGFMSEEDARIFVGHLQALGLASPSGGMATDVAIVDQVRGAAYDTPWLTLGRLNLPEIGGEVCVALLSGSTEQTLATPATWRFEGSLSQLPRQAGAADQSHLKYLRHQDGVDVYWDSRLGAEVYSGRAYRPAEAGPAADAASRARHNELYERALTLAREAKVFELLPPAKVGWFASRRIAKAIALFDQALEIVPSNWTAHWMRAKCLQAQGSFDESLAGFSQAWLLNPGNSDIAREAGISATEAGKLDVAIYYAQEALKLKPNDAGLRTNLAMAYLFAGNLDAATVEVTAAVAAAPNDSISRMVLLLVNEVAAGRMQRPTRTGDIDFQALRQAGARG